MIEPRLKGGNLSETKISRGRETLRLRSKGPATLEEMVCLYRQNIVFETFRTIYDCKISDLPFYRSDKTEF